MTRTKILIIEDNEQNLYLMRFLLEHEGYKVVSAVDGREGIEMASRERPDAILLDIQLPLLDGYGVARELRKVDELASVPIIAVTSYAMPADRGKCLAAGATGYMEKPIDPDTFVSHVRKYLPEGVNRDEDPDS
ncbi:MAG: response regulator [Thermovirga sp.]